jgi:hypothetical protein
VGEAGIAQRRAACRVLDVPKVLQRIESGRERREAADRGRVEARLRIEDRERPAGARRAR